MRESLGSVLKYRMGKLEMIVRLPEKRPVCQYCRFIHWESGIRRATCILTDEMLIDFEVRIGGEMPDSLGGK